MTAVLIIDDEHTFSNATAELLRAEGHSVMTADTLERGSRLLDEKSFDLLLVDLMLPDGNGLELLDRLGEDRPPQVVIITGHPSIKSMIRKVHGPGLSYLTKPVDIEELRAIAGSASKDENSDEVVRHFGVIIGESPGMHKVYDQIRQVAPTDTTVLITGESGTGKELVAEALHHESGRAGKFVPVNCGGLTTELIASELFGHEKGSFTGAAKRHLGCFERADNGTLFLDEITELPIEQQPHLLRALETGRITRVGGEGEVPVNARIVTASNRKLSEAIEEGVLRQDLYFRLNVFMIHLPPLRNRPSDIDLLARAFLNALNRKQGTSRYLDDAGLARLKSWHWPGNVRELKHTVHRCYVSAGDREGPLEIPEEFTLEIKSGTGALMPGRSIRDVERELIESTLDHFEGNKKAAAEALGVSLKTLYNRLSEYNTATEE